MALEDLVGPDKFLDALVITNPEATDVVEEGDDHLRGLKNVCINSFGAMDEFMSFVAGTPIIIPDVIEVPVVSGAMVLQRAGGNVGIGVVPTELLHMQFNGNVICKLESLGGAGVGVATSYENTVRDWQAGLGPGTGTDNYNIYDATQALVRLSIDSSGFVGLGTFAPTVKLDLAGADNLSTRMRMVKTAAGALELGADRTTSAVPYIGSTSIHDFAFLTQDVEVARFTTLGRLGINTTTPEEILTIQGASARLRASLDGTTAGAIFGVLANGDGLLQLTVDGAGTNTSLRADAAASFINAVNGENLGIGIAAPTEPLHVVAPAINSNIARFTGANANRGLVISATANGVSNDSLVGYNAVSTVALGAHRWQTDGTERMRLDENGRLGIGLATPSELLTLSAQAGDTAISLENATAGQVWKMVADAAGILSFQDSTFGKTPLSLIRNHDSNLLLGNATMTWRNDTAAATVQFDLINGNAYTWRQQISAADGFGIRDITGGNSLKFQIDPGITSLVQLQTRIMTWSDPNASDIKFRLMNDFKQFDMQITGGTNSWEIFDNNSSAVRHRITSSGLHLLFLPTADPGSPGALWNNNGVVNVSP